MTDPRSTRVLRGAEAAPFEFPPVGTPPKPASEFVAWGAPAGAGPGLRAPATQDAYDEGLRDGRAEAEAEAWDQIEALRTEMAESKAAHAEAEAEASRRAQETARDLSERWTKAVRDLEPSLVDFALHVATEMLGAAPSEAAQQAGAQAIAEAIDGLADGNPTTITLHPVDLLKHQESGFADTLSGAHPLLRWEPDSSVAPGDWVVSTPEAAVRRIISEALMALRDRLGLSAP